MCGVHAMSVMPSATAMRAISSDMSRLREPSSMPGRIWLWRSITGRLLAVQGPQVDARQQRRHDRIGGDVHVEFHQRMQEEAEQAQAAQGAQHLVAAQAAP